MQSAAVDDGVIGERPDMREHYEARTDDDEYGDALYCEW